MSEFIFTFGFGHTNPRTGESRANKFARIEAPDSDAARAIMFAKFGRQWAFQYESEDAAGVSKYHLTEEHEAATHALKRCTICGAPVDTDNYVYVGNSRLYSCGEHACEKELTYMAQQAQDEAAYEAAEDGYSRYMA